MTYMVVSSVIPGKYEAAIKQWAKRMEPPDGVKALSAWHVMVSTTSFVVWEADSLVSLTKALRPWQELMNLEIYPVVDDEEARTFLA